MVCAAAKPLRGRSPGPRPKRSEAWDQVNDLAMEKKNRLQGGGGRTHNNCVEWYELCNWKGKLRSPEVRKSGSPEVQKSGSPEV